jgi:hypothetical protein
MYYLTSYETVHDISWWVSTGLGRCSPGSRLGRSRLMNLYLDWLPHRPGMIQPMAATTTLYAPLTSC